MNDGEWGGLDCCCCCCCCCCCGKGVSCKCEHEWIGGWCDYLLGVAV